MRTSRTASLKYCDAHNCSRHKCYASECKCEIDGSTFSVVHLSPYRVTLQK